MSTKPAQLRRGTARHHANLTALALVVTAVGHAAVDWSVARQLQPGTLTRLIVFSLVSVGLYQTVVRTLPHATAVLLPGMLLLTGLGITVIGRVDLATGGRLAATQLVWFTVGAAGFLAATFLSRHLTRAAQYPYLLLGVTLGLLLLPLLPGISAGVINGARLWIDVFGMRFQPGEAAKLTLVLFLAAYLSRHHARLSLTGANVPLRQYGPVVAASITAVLVLIGLRDLGAAVLLLAITLLMVFVVANKLSILGVGAGVFLAGTWLAQHQFAHVANRFAVWRDPFQDVFGSGYQLSQSLFAFATGGLTGTGFGFGRPEDLPFAATDAVFAVLGEELGLLGVTAVIGVLVLIVMRGMRIATHAPDRFVALVAFGFTVTFALQTFLILAGITRMLPLTGLTLPFVSYGGSSLVINMTALGVLLAIDHDTKRHAFDGRTVRR